MSLQNYFTVKKKTYPLHRAQSQLTFWICAGHANCTPLNPQHCTGWIRIAQYQRCLLLEMANIAAKRQVNSAIMQKIKLRQIAEASRILLSWSSVNLGLELAQVTEKHSI